MAVNNYLFVNIHLTKSQSSIITKQQGETQVQRGYQIQHVYSKEELLQVGQDLNTGSHLRQIHPNVCVQIRKLWLNKRKCSKKGGSATNADMAIPQQVDFNNLIIIYIDNRPKMDIANDLSLMLANVQSIKSKTKLLMDYLLDSKVDIAVLTEAWLSDDDAIWLKASDLNGMGTKQYTKIDQNIKVLR